MRWCLLWPSIVCAVAFVACDKPAEPCEDDVFTVLCTDSHGVERMPSTGGATTYGPKIDTGIVPDPPTTTCITTGRTWRLAPDPPRWTWECGRGETVCEECPK